MFATVLVHVFTTAQVVAQTSEGWTLSSRNSDVDVSPVTFINMLPVLSFGLMHVHK